MTGRRRLTVNYLLEDTALFGGVKIPLHHANLLHRRGHRVRVLSRGPRPDWYPLAAPFTTVPDFEAGSVAEADVHVATFWTTIAPAAALPHGQPVHFCQGFEASYTHNGDQHPAILESYALPLPTFALSPHLAELVHRRFGRPVRVVPPALERMWRQRWRRAPARRPRVVVAHPFEADWKGVATALEAVRRLREDGLELTLVRLSQWSLSEAERSLLEPDEFHCRLAPAEVPALIAGCDLLLAPSWEQEGFGLPVLEAMACGVPVVASRIQAFTGYAAGAAELVPVGDAAAFAGAARAILGDRRRWREMRRAGLGVAAAFSERRVVAIVEDALHWAAGGAWRPS
ncbi:MAG TPA: glycosyltransferase family 4 protein [Thermoanaerobaculales bacterium]|nr:glycosyltransferase family 4 protein [Thermoanaerobaculales bacterium]HPA80223.1 glycosyltransferase family 4 protein [Thermoanaerobaculales bacterium]HQL29592.1 glycosyltransferase family 4 protein [Thermoanaerobaculales bacterium]HQP44368.1 glycosyltransferase family 4 protein [Thermoanaerobaculales bacterium]